jgi:hypothetical protein
MEGPGGGEAQGIADPPPKKKKKSFELAIIKLILDPSLSLP